MGATEGYCRPVDTTRLSSWRAHTNRSTPSVEPGVDYYVPTGTPVRAASSGVVVDVGGSIYAATGRYVTVDLDDGRRVRYLHLLRSRVREGQRVQWGEVIADSGASGYGSDFFGEPSRNSAFWNNTGGDHVHMTLWAHQEYKFGRYATLDPEQYMAVEQSGSSVTPAIILPEEDDMKLLHITDSVDGGAKPVPGWVLLNTRTGEFLHLRSDGAGNQERANGWARVWGNARSCNRQDLKNAIAAIEQTT